MTKLALFYLLITRLGSRADLEDDLLEGYRRKIPRKFLEFFRRKSNLNNCSFKVHGRRLFIYKSYHGNALVD